MAKRTKKQRRGRKKELTVWDRFWLWVKVNEKVFWVVLLVLISFSFAFTGATAQFFDRMAGKQPFLKISDEVYYRRDYESVMSEIELVGRIKDSLAVFTGRGGAHFGNDRLNAVDYLLCQKDAKRLGIFVSDEELGHEIRRLYWGLKAMRAGWESPRAVATRKLDYQTMFSTFADLQDTNAWNYAEWVQILRGPRWRIETPRFFDEALRRFVRSEKVVDYVRDSVQVSAEDLYQNFLEREQFRKLSFFEMKPGPEMDAAQKSDITDDELRDFFSQNQFRFRPRQVEMKLETLYIPYEAFRKDLAEITDEELEKKYRELRVERFRRDPGTADLNFDLRTPEEERQFEEALYRPLEEVKDDVVEAVIDEKCRDRAAKFASEISSGKLQFSADGTTNFEEIVKQSPFVEHKTSPFFSRSEARKVLGPAYTFRVATWFSQAEQNAREQDPTKRKKLEPLKTSRHSDAGGLVFYGPPKVRYPEPPKYEDVADDVREKLVMDRALDLLKERADRLARAVREGEKTLQAAAEEVGSEVISTAFLKHTDQIMVPVQEEAETETSDEVEEPQTEAYPGSVLILGEAFAVQEEGQVGQPVRDEEHGTYYIVRLDKKLRPDPEDFEDSPDSFRRSRLLEDRRNYYLQTWRKELWARAGVERFSMKRGNVTESL